MNKKLKDLIEVTHSELRLMLNSGYESAIFEYATHYTIIPTEICNFYAFIAPKNKCICEEKSNV